MPQMAPLSWLFLMILFVTILFTFNIINYFSFSSQVKESHTETITPNISWKW